MGGAAERERKALEKSFKVKVAAYLAWVWLAVGVGANGGATKGGRG